MQNIVEQFARSDLIAHVGYRPEVSVEEGVANFVRWYRDYYGT